MNNLVAKNSLNQKQLQLLQSEFDVQNKSAIVAYLLLLFFGSLGAHRFYLGRKSSAVAQLAISIIGTLCVFVMLNIAIGLFVAVGSWVIVDLFLTAGMVREENERIESEIISRVSTMA